MGVDVAMKVVWRFDTGRKVSDFSWLYVSITILDDVGVEMGSSKT